MDAVTVNVVSYGLTAVGAAWVIHWENREQRIQEWLKTVRIKFRPADGDDAPGYFIWTSVQPPRGPSATESTQAWWDSLDVEDQEAIEQLDDITTGRVA